MSLYSLIVQLFNVYEFLIVVWCLLSWVRFGGPSWLTSFREALGMLVEPYLGFFRRFIPPFGGIDFSPVVAIFALSLIERVLLSVVL